ncbi:MAG: serine/threonine protein phosphatase [Gammaproteobacteria bacterium]|nr:serine/threonine protein phosphatase [Gemmatimonadota bacterium]NIT89442.1 serine/threonine protein phosphatase [Gemmatimonadota bacterium]NIU75920.1 serine/threonine protein phosphatase [Gammaproteobacteria bacterium]NIX41574.1 serine/threonine protein phosphatase [Gemmatimonadota bacterium]
MAPAPTPSGRLWPLLLVAATACAAPATQNFHNDVTSSAKPWTHDDFDAEEGKFTFAVFSDLNGGERSGVFKVAVEQLSLLRPELILSVGDLIDGGTEDRERLRREWDHFDARASRARAPVFRVGGNHDLTNITMRRVWAERHGPRYYHFVYGNVLFLALDSEDYTPERLREIYDARAAYIEAQDAGADGLEEMEYYRMPERLTGEIGPEQSRYFLDVLDRHPDVRWTMLFMHKPVWLGDADPEFVAIESALANRAYTVFNGHFHRFSHTVKNGRDYIMLGTTGGGQGPSRPESFDHVTLVTVAGDGPSITHLKLEAILDETGRVPAGGDTLCFQAYECG